MKHFKILLVNYVFFFQALGELLGAGEMVQWNLAALADEENSSPTDPQAALKCL